ncbi:MAG TPA: hypothetical protein VN032_10065 [Thermoanaerobaculia bacterium]|nr:hypothetical protein [Thermoanaerobaculia bacterium]
MKKTCSGRMAAGCVRLSRAALFAAAMLPIFLAVACASVPPRPEAVPQAAPADRVLFEECQTGSPFFEGYAAAILDSQIAANRICYTTRPTPEELRVVALRAMLAADPSATDSTGILGDAFVHEWPCSASPASLEIAAATAAGGSQ